MAVTSSNLEFWYYVGCVFEKRANFTEATILLEWQITE